MTHAQTRLVHSSPAKCGACREKVRAGPRARSRLLRGHIQRRDRDLEAKVGPVGDVEPLEYGIHNVRDWRSAVDNNFLRKDTVEITDGEACIDVAESELTPLAHVV